MNRPLEGIRVLDMARVLSGPHCAMIMADLGADVIKIEKPGEGDMTRSNNPKVNGESTYFMAHNRNKKSITLDFRKPESKDIFFKLLKTADVVVENFRAGTMEKMGLGFDVLKEVNPKIILTRISGFGQDGPYADRTCFDGAAQSMSGLVSITGDPDGAPYMTGTYIIDYGSAFYACIGTLSALRQAEQTGHGQVVDVALLDVAASVLHTAIPDHFMLGMDMGRNGNNDRYMWPANIYPAKNNRWVYMHIGMEHCYTSFMKAIGKEALLSDEKHCATREARSSAEGRKFNDDIIIEWCKDKTAEEIIDFVAPLGIPCAKVNNIDEAMEDPQLKHRKMFQPFEITGGIKGVMAGTPVKLSGSEFETKLAPPLLGEHTEDVLKSIGYSESEIKDFKDKKVI